MSRNADAFDDWIRTRFVDFNTTLENLYFARIDRADVVGVGDDVKAALAEEGRGYVRALMLEGNTDEGFDRAFDMLGNLGLYMAALRRHELTNPAREDRSPLAEASALGLHVGAALGVAPRFATSHLATHNKAVDGRPKCFTALADEALFLDENTRGIFAYKRAADALMRISPLGVSHAVAATLFEDARAALEDVAAINRRLFETLDQERFFFSVRPYYKTYRVGRQEYRGANAGDFSGINEIDLLLGLCRANDPYYSQLLVDKMLFMRPEDQASLRDCMRRGNFLDAFLEAAPTSASAPWFRTNAAAFLEVCAAHGRAAALHHDQLVARFIVAPAGEIDPRHLAQITASGPALEALIGALAKLRDLRLAADTPGIGSRHADLARLRAVLAA
ncbi:MAG: DUF1864 family protein [Parvularculaceae bacterium]|nr:DUF1864 family protein [Parvularculaceae bacterium]